MPGLLQDIQYGIRQLRKRPGWSLTIILVLAIAIGSNTTMYSAFEAWVLRPLDFDAPDQLVALDESQPKLGREQVSVSPANLGDWRAQQRSFQDLAAYRRVFFNLSADGEPVRVQGTLISSNLFSLLGKQPALGRGIAANEDLPSQPAPVALISDQMWRERFDGLPTVLGRTVRLDGREHEVIGVMEPGFAFPEWADVWAPLAADERGGARDARSLNVVARLADGVSIEAAGEDLRQISSRLEQQYPETNQGWSSSVTSLRDQWVPEVIEVAMAACMGSAFFVLMVICANVGSLILAQAAARSRETALRTALGASRLRLIQQSVVETMILALLASVLGMVVAQVGVSGMLSSVPLEPPYLFAMKFSPAAAGYTVLIALLAGAFCGLVPLLQASGRRTFEKLKSGQRAGDGVALVKARSFLVVGELALSTALVVAALLMVKSFLLQQNKVSGFTTDGIFVSDLTLGGDDLADPSRRREAGQRILAGLAGVGSFDQVALVTSLPSSSSDRITGLEAEGHPVQEGETVNASHYGMTGGYLEVLDIAVLSGRNFTAAEDQDGGRIALVSQKLGEALWGGQDPVGRKLRTWGSGDEAWLTVVGVVSDVAAGRDMVSFGEHVDKQLYVPWSENASPSVTVAVSSDRPLDVMREVLRDVMRSAVPGVPIAEILSMDEAMLRARWVSRFFSQQLAIYAAFAMLIAAIGLYGLTADSVGQRRHELAVRSVFGARRKDLVWMILREALRLGGLGVLLGLVIGLVTTGFGGSMLDGVGARDPLVFISVALLFIGVTLLAAFLPARKATLLDPSEALRSE